MCWNVKSSNNLGPAFDATRRVAYVAPPVAKNRTRNASFLEERVDIS